MDQRQKDLIESKIRDLAESITFERVANALQEKGAVPKQRLKEISVSFGGTSVPRCVC